ncbi:hypothetical protein IGI04_002447, partial [Brassica rapa subsp. trilocularis]
IVHHSVLNSLLIITRETITHSLWFKLSVCIAEAIQLASLSSSTPRMATPRSSARTGVSSITESICRDYS